MPPGWLRNWEIHGPPIPCCLGMLSTALEFPAKDWQAIIAHSVPPRTVEVNHQAFLLGREWIQSDEHKDRSACKLKWPRQRRHRLSKM